MGFCKAHKLITSILKAEAKVNLKNFGRKVKILRGFEIVCLKFFHHRFREQEV